METQTPRKSYSKIIGIVAVVVVLAAVWFLWPTKPPVEVPRATTDTATTTVKTPDVSAELGMRPTLASVNAKNVSFAFTGYGPGKSHLGTFTKIERASINIQNGLIIGGTLIIDASSVDTKNTSLDTHLKSADFFNTALYPKIEFVLSELKPTSENLSTFTATGQLDFHGVKKSITFPVSYATSTNKYSTDFILSLKDFNISYKGVNDGVRIEASFSIQE